MRMTPFLSSAAALEQHNERHPHRALNTVRLGSFGEPLRQQGNSLGDRLRNGAQANGRGNIVHGALLSTRTMQKEYAQTAFWSS